MKIKNDYVKVRIGKKQVEFNNMILDTYLRYMSEIQSDYDAEYWQSPLLSKCYLKFNKKLEFDETSILTRYDFDEELEMTNNYINNSASKIEAQYIYEGTGDYVGKKITAIGFFTNDDPNCYACLDLSAYSLAIKTNDIVSVVRKDTITTEAFFNSSSSKITYPLHLSPVVKDWIIENPRTSKLAPVCGNFLTAKLQSVGLGTNKYEMQKEISLNADNTIYRDNKIIFRDIFGSENLLDILQPNFKYPSNNLYPSNTENYFTYIFFKYKLYYNVYTEVGSSLYEHMPYNAWYTLSVPIKTTGNFDYAISYERSDENGI